MKQCKVKKLMSAGLLCAGLLLALTGCRTGENDDTKSADQTTEANTATDSTEEEKANGLTFPYVLDDGQLQVNSVFSSDIDNPDADDQYADGIISIELENVSTSTLTDASLTLTAENGQTVEFHVEYLPAGKKAWAFALDNTTLEDVGAENDIITEAIEVVSTYDNTDLLDSDEITVSVEGTTVTLTNKSSEDKTNLNVSCHCNLDDVYYGGMVYTYTADSLPAGETTTIDASDCFLGTAEVVCIEEK